jgi:RNA polymerase sigma factor (sigma-70 family)
MKAHWRGIMLMLEKLVSGDVATAEDLAQKTFHTAWTKRHKVPDEPGGWLFTTARNHWLNHRRYALRRSFVPYDHHSMEHLHPAPAADAALEAEEPGLEAAVEGLTDSDRTILVLRYVDGLDCNEIAEELQISSATARKRLSRAEKKVLHLRQQPKDHTD